MASTKTPAKVTNEQIKLARAAGFKAKKPKKPKGKITPDKFNAYVDKYNSWAKDLKAKAAEGKKKQTAKNALKSLRSRLSGL